MERLKLLFRLARLHFLVPGFMLYVLGYLLAILNNASFDLSKFLIGYVVFGCAHLSVHFSNDYYDRISDRGSVRTVFSGGSGVLVEHPELQMPALKLAISFLAASVTVATIFTFMFAYSYWFLAFVIFGGLLGWFYTAPPLKLAYRKLSEASTVLAVGLMMPGMGYFVGYGSINALFAVFIFPLSCYGLLFIITVEMPDIESDRKATKINALVKWGLQKGIWISLFSTLAGTLSFAIIQFSGVLTGKMDLGPTLVFSFAPVAGVASNFFANSKVRICLTRQVAINMTAMVLFLFLFDLYLLYQVII